MAAANTANDFEHRLATCRSDSCDLWKVLITHVQAANYTLGDTLRKLRYDQGTTNHLEVLGLDPSFVEVTEMSVGRETVRASREAIAQLIARHTDLLHCDNGSFWLSEEPFVKDLAQLECKYLTTRLSDVNEASDVLLGADLNEAIKLYRNQQEPDIKFVTSPTFLSSRNSIWGCLVPVLVTLGVMHYLNKVDREAAERADSDEIRDTTVAGNVEGSGSDSE